MKAVFLTVVLLPSVFLTANAFAPPQLCTPLKVVSSTKHVTTATTPLHAASANSAIDSVLFRGATSTPNISSSMRTTSPPPLLLRRRQGGRKEMILARCLAVALAMTTTTVLEQGRGSVAHAASTTTAATTTANRIHNSNLAPSIRPVVRVKRRIAATSTMSKQSLMETSTANNNVVRVMTGTGVVLGAAGAGLYVGDSVRKQQKQSGSTNDDDDDELPEKTMLANFSSNMKEAAFKKVELEEVEEEEPAVMEMVVEQKEEQVVEAAAKTAATNEATRQFFQRVLEEQQQKLEKARQEKIASVMNNGAKIAKTIGFTTRIVDQKPPPVIITNDDEPAPNGYITREEEPPVYPTTYTDDMSVEEPVMIEDEHIVSSTIPVAVPMGTVPISMPPVGHDVLSAPIVERPRLVPQPVEVATTTTTNTLQQQQRRLPLMTAKYIKARKQPKSPKDEMKLAEKYAAIDSLEERAFQILVDLGMVEVNEATDNNNNGN